MEIGLPRVVLYLYNVYLENKDSDDCTQLLEKEFNKNYGIKMVDDGHDCNIASMNSLNIHDVNMITLVMIMISPIRMSILEE